MRVVVAMSGGVDSSAAAALLREAGHEVIGISLRLSRQERSVAPGRCCSPDDLDDARAVARALDIPFYVFEATDLFDEAVIQPFVTSYLGGDTPIPCVECNRSVKFGHLLRRARALGGKLATGHYARIDEEGGRYRLLRGVDASRDQSYFLHHLGQRELADLLFPVGGLTKQQAREAARRAGLPVADKPESQDICFIPEGDAAAFVERNAARVGGAVRPGRIVGPGGEELAAHDGLHRFTVGQRKGLAAAASKLPAPGGHKLPIYVQALRPETGEVVVGHAQDIERTRFGVRRVTWVAGSPPPAGQEVTVRVRHRHAGARCVVEEGAAGEVLVRALEPVRAPAPGQSAVFYAGEEVLGGGTIARAG